MRALRFDKTGSLDSLKVSDIPKPAPGPDEVLVEVKAAAVNPSDKKMCWAECTKQRCPELLEEISPEPLSRVLPSCSDSLFLGREAIWDFAGTAATLNLSWCLKSLSC